jgi:NitT/TauT family transport system substrate-binding protein
MWIQLLLRSDPRSDLKITTISLLTLAIASADMIKVMHLRKKWVTLLLCVGLFILSGLGVVACNPQSTTQTAAKTLTVGVSPWPGYAGHYVAMAKDLFKAEGVTVKEVFFPNQGDSDTAFLSGKVDISWQGLPNAVLQMSRDPSIKVVFQGDYSNGSDGIIGRNIKKPEDLKGQKVAREEILFEELLLRKYLEKMGLSPDDVSRINLTAADAAAAFTAGKVNVAITFEPWMTKAAKEGKGEVVFSTKDTNIIPDGIVVRDELIQKHKTELLAYVKAIGKAVDLIRKNTPDTTEIIAKSLSITTAEVPEQMGGVKLYDAAMNKSITFNRQDPMNLFTSLEAASKTAQEMKLIPKPVDINAAMNDSIVTALN